MRTTISISEPLLEAAKRASLERKCTLGEVIEEALKLSLLTRKNRSAPEQVQVFKTFSGNGTQMGVDLHSNSSLADRMESL